MEMIKWTNADIKKLLTCETDAELMKAFPGHKVDSLTRKRRKLRSEGHGVDTVKGEQSVYTVIVLPDMQIPYHDKRAINAVERFMGAHRFDEYIQVGDLMDFDFISSFNEKALRNLEGKRFVADYGIANALLDRHQELIRKNNPSAKFTLLEGNHEERVERLIDHQPSFEGLVEVSKNLKLKERGFKWIQSWSKGEVYKVGKANFSHGLYTNTHHAKKMAEAFGDNIFYGHVHDVMTFSKSTKGLNKTTVGQSLGCLCTEQAWMKGSPTNWQQAFAVFYFLPDGYFSYYIPRIFNGRFVGPDGKVYQGK